MAQQCFVAILLITIVALAVARTKPSLSRVFVLLFATYSGLYAARSLPVSSLLLTLIVAPLWTQALARGPRQSRSLFAPPSLSFAVAGIYRASGPESNWASAAISGRWLRCFFGVLVCPHQGKLGSTQWMNAHFDPKNLPVQATDAIVQRGLREPIFAPDSWGGYLIYRLYPAKQGFR